MSDAPGDNILVTGALGQIGTDLVEALREAHGTDSVIPWRIHKKTIGRYQ